MKPRSWTARLRGGVETGLAVALRTVIAPLPVDARIRVGGGLGRMIVPNYPATRARVDRNLAFVFPDMTPRARREVARAVGDNFGRLLTEYSCLDRLAALPDRTTIAGPGLDALHAARADGKGAVIASAHFGNWEAIRLALLHAGIPCGMIYRAFNNPGFDAIVRGQMANAGTPVMVKGYAGMRAFVAHVARGGVALILVDQKQTGAPLVPFLGHPAETMPAAAEIATRFGVPLIPASALRHSDGLHFSVTFDAQIPDGPAAERMAALNARIGDWIAAHPGQWFWLHNRWRHV